MKPEAALWGRVKQHLPGVAERMENAAGSGTPDVYAVFDKHGVAKGKSYWLELKVKPVIKQVDDPTPLLRPSQLAWHAKFALQGAHIMVLLETSNEYTLFIRRKGHRSVVSEVDYINLLRMVRTPGALRQLREKIEESLEHA